MTGDRQSGTTLRLRLLGAFVLVAAVAIGAFAALTLSAGRGDVAQLVRHQQQQTRANTVTALVDAYRAAQGWQGADLGSARAIAVAGGALLEVRDRSGSLVARSGRGLGPGWMRNGMMSTSPETAYASAVAAPLVVNGNTVGTATVRFPKSGLPPAERQLRDALTRTTVYGALIAAAVALIVGLIVAEGITRPLRRLTIAVQRLGRGDRSARANLTAPGELGELAAAVDTMAANLEREDDLRRSLTADVAHELRTPVTILAAQCEALLDGITPAGREQLASLHEEVLRLGRVIEDLETLASAEAAGLRLNRADVDFDAITAQTVSLLAPQFDAADVSLTLERSPVHVQGDPLRLGQVVRNLLSNALKFTPAGGHATVRVGASGDEAELRVTDDGIGVPAEELGHVFDRYWRGTNTGSTAGSGIGLAVVRQLVEAHGGRVAMANDPDMGTTVTVRLPLA